MNIMSMRNLPKNRVLAHNSLLLALVGLSNISLVGCGQHNSPPQLTSVPALSQTSLPPQQQEQCEQLATSIIGAIQKGDKKEALKLLSPALAANSTATQAILSTSGPYALLAGASGWSYEPATTLGTTKTLVLHAKFISHDGSTCRTNFILEPSGDKLVVKNIVPPGKQHPPTAGKPVKGQKR